MFCSEISFRTTRELESFFFVAQSAIFFFRNSTLGYMTKTLNQIIFFPPPKSKYFFQQHWESEYFFFFFLEKNINPLKLNGRSLINLKDAFALFVILFMW